MTIQELHETAPETQQFYISENGYITELHRLSGVELDAYNGYLGDDRYYTMDELDECFIGTEPSEILHRAFYGYDAETYTYGQFNPNRDYFTYNGYGNLVSADYKDYTGYLDKYAIEAMGENRRYIDSIEQSNELAALFDELENTEN